MKKDITNMSFIESAVLFNFTCKELVSVVIVSVINSVNGNRIILTAVVAKVQFLSILTHRNCLCCFGKCDKLHERE